MKIFLTGGTGYTGGETIGHLLDAGHQVVAIARNVPTQAPVRDGLHWVEGDFADGALIERLAREADGVLHIGASHDADMERLDGIFIRAVGDALAGTGKAFVSTSATPVYGDTGPDPRDEHEPINNPLPFREWRMRHDNEVVGFADRGIRSVIVRPGLIYGKAGGPLSWNITRARATGKALYVADGRAASSAVHVDALAKLYILALENDAARGIYNAASDETILSVDIAETIAAFYGPGIVAESWPLDEARNAIGGFADLSNTRCIVSSARARRELGWLPVGPTVLSELVGGSYRSGPLAPYGLGQAKAAQ
ncbi:MAG TPA: NAD-dependent epimerase/dehydratase family protein [Sphingobium sp.]|uniref:NAD-dependent epimerase/dehydratase family protein n=1 Tax=Sphingobium sp. TaxID=1912891 RepID=UPI002ED53261